MDLRDFICAWWALQINLCYPVNIIIYRDVDPTFVNHFTVFGCGHLSVVGWCPATQPRNAIWKVRAGATSVSGNKVIRDLILCDMDASTKMGELKPKKLKISEGYMAPETAVYMQVHICWNTSTHLPPSSHGVGDGRLHIGAHVFGI